jgi:hypothetical protein
MWDWKRAAKLVHERCHLLRVSRDVEVAGSLKLNEALKEARRACMVFRLENRGLLSLLDAARVKLADEQRRAEKLLSEENLQARWTLEAQDEVRRLREEMKHVDKDTYR